tara:strand:- start:259 stop:594 length:336 start_codon:yes stop_codon:yes gene_type:complete
MTSGFIKLVSFMISSIFTTTLVLPIVFKLMLLNTAFAETTETPFNQKIIGQSGLLANKLENSQIIWPVEKNHAPRRKEVDNSNDVIGYPIDNPKQMVPSRSYNLDFLLFAP